MPNTILLTIQLPLKRRNEIWNACLHYNEHKIIYLLRVFVFFFFFFFFERDELKIMNIPSFCLPYIIDISKCNSHHRYKNIKLYLIIIVYKTKKLKKKQNCKKPNHECVFEKAVLQSICGYVKSSWIQYNKSIPLRGGIDRERERDQTTRKNIRNTYTKKYRKKTPLRALTTHQRQ